MKNRLLAVIVVLGLCGCGGGGGDSLSLSLSAAPLKGSFFPSELPKSVQMQATVRGEVAASEIYVVIADDAGTFAPGPAWIRELGGDRYEATLSTADNLAVGVHSGNLQVRICADEACRTVLASGSRPYEITIKPPTILGLPESFIYPAMQNGPVGLLVRLQDYKRELPIYVAASDAAGRFSSAVVPLLPLPSSFVEYTADLPMAAGLPAQSLSGSVTLKFCGDAACTSVFSSTTLPYRIQVFVPVADLCCAFKLALDAQENLYVANGGSIVRLTPEGVESTVYQWNPDDGHPQPSAVAVDAAGYVWFSNDIASGLDKIAPDGTISRYHHGSTSDLAFDSSGYRYELSYSRAAVFRSGPEGGIEPGWGAPFRLERATGLAVADDRVAYVAEGRGVIRIQDTTATVLAPLPDGQGARDVEVAGSGSLLVSGENGGLYRLTSAGAVEVIIPQSATSTSGETGLAVGSIARTPEGRAYFQSSRGLVSTQLP